jgi:hypothetical protein
MNVKATFTEGDVKAAFTPVLRKPNGQRARSFPPLASVRSERLETSRHTLAADEEQSSAIALASLLLLARAALSLDVIGVAASRETQHSATLA